MVKFKEEETECKRHKEIKSGSRLEEGMWGYTHIRTGVLEVKVSRVLSITEMPYYILMVTE